MATNGNMSGQAFAPVLTALQTMQSNADRAQKSHAHTFLEEFQKSPEAWSTTFTILQSPDATIEAKLFAATTLKGKIVYDVHQLPSDSLPPLRDSLIGLLSTFRTGPKPIRTQLCVCLANLAIQMTQWRDVISDVLAALGSDSRSIPSVLEFLHVLPEEVTEGRKINLTEDQLNQRIPELLEENADKVLGLLTQYAQSSASASKNPQLLECIASWIRELPINDIVNSPLLGSIFSALLEDVSFDEAVECLSAILKETRDVDECLNVIQKLYPRIIDLQPKIAEVVEADDIDRLKGFTRIFAEAGESWVVLIARAPEQFKDLVTAILECAARDKGRHAISRTFIFWYDLKQLLTIERYVEARLQYVELYSNLVDIMISHLEYPNPEDGNSDLFEGDREQEDKFREFRHEIGDVLKDCCEVIGVTECLQKSYGLLEGWIQTYGAQTANTKVPAWQKLEASVFSMRAMGRMVPPDESIMLPKLIPLILQLPDHEKVRFQAILALGRYTVWTASHPNTLQPQLDYIIAAFSYPSKEVVRAAALSFKFFCNDCAGLLKNFSEQLQQFYTSVLPKLQIGSQEEITDGVASVIAQLPNDKIYETFKLYCDPVVKSLIDEAETAKDDAAKNALADRVQLVTIFVQWIRPAVNPGQVNPAVEYCQEIFPVLGGLAQKFVTFAPMLERVCRCWRYMVFSYRTTMTPLLPDLANKLVAGFATSRQGCFLWATAAVIREFGMGRENVDEVTLNAVFQFYEQQATTFLRALNDLIPEELPDVIEDFFRLSADALIGYPYRTIGSTLMAPILSAASTALTLLKEESLLATLHFLRDFVAWGSDEKPTSNFDEESQQTPQEIKTAVKQLFIANGETIVQRLMTGMMYSFPSDCFPDASGVLLATYQLLPNETAEWIEGTVQMLPTGSITTLESERLLNNIKQRMGSQDVRKVRTLLQDFTNSYRRRNVAPREGLGRLDPVRFKFVG